MDLTRRQLLGGVVAGAAAASILSVAEAADAASKNVSKKGTKRAKMSIPQLKNEDFYKDGKFNVEAAKQAYYDMFKRFNYPIVDRLKTDDFWALDFNLGSFSTVGMAGIFWINNLKGNYFGHEIFLLPGQMIPEHRHMKTELAGPKMEGWHVRYGSICTFCEGEARDGWDKIVPAAHQGDYLKCKKYIELKPGQTNDLAGAEQWHFMVAGPEGAIVSEYATYHDSNGLRFSHPKAKL
jgi:D-lyxose ketol-isomerase